MNDFISKRDVQIYREAQSKNMQHSIANTIFTTSTKLLIKAYLSPLNNIPFYTSIKMKLSPSNSIERTWFWIELLILHAPSFALASSLISLIICSSVLTWFPRTLSILFLAKFDKLWLLMLLYHHISLYPPTTTSTN